MNANPDVTKGISHAQTAPAFLSVWDMHAYYGESYIVQGITFNVHEGEILALLGRNGAGKTTTLRSIARIGSPEVRHGEIWLDHQPLHNMSSHEAAQAGLGLVPEDRRIIPGLTVEENLKLAQIAPPIGWSIDRLYNLFPRLGERRNQEGTTLSGGEQQMLTMCRTLIGDPEFIMIDEPTEGLSPQMTQRVAELLKEIAKRKVATLLVEQKLSIAMDIADRVYVMGHGQVVFEGTPAELKGRDDVRKEWLEV